MGYAIALEADAEADLMRLQTAVRGRVMAALLALAQSPGSAATRPTRVPLPPGQLYQNRFLVQDVACHLDVVFRYGQDEQMLYISRVFVEYE